jgi:TolB-like protein/DNA-binding winged helix-turn-helix (wHTH) protein/tetratricopeptide (TPR) repeat protein
MSVASNPIRFGRFDLDLVSGELRKDGRKIRLADQPLQVLTLLLNKPGKLVTREELRQRLWSSDTFVDFEHSVNAAVKRLREALGDSADNPRFIETLHGHGYRFITPVVGLTDETRTDPVTSDPQEPDPSTRALRWAVIALLLAVAAGSYPVGKWIWQWGHSSQEPIRAIAVLPLVNLSSDPVQEYFSDSMTEALITELSRIRALRVISRQSVMHYKGTTKTVPQIALELNVEAVVEGSALRDGDKIRISAQLIRARPEEHLWAQSYEQDVTEILALQRSVARDIVTHVQVTLTPQEEMHLATSRPRNPKSYDEYLLARFFHAKWTTEDVQKAFVHAQHAAKLDPNDAASQALLSTMYFTLETFGQITPEEAVRGEAVTAKKALELDDALAEAHSAIGWVKMVEWNWGEAEKELKRAIELNPGSVYARTNYSWYLSYVGRHDESIEEMRKVVEMEPLSVWAQTCMGYRFSRARRYDEAIAQFRKMLELEPGNGILHRELAKALTAKGSFAEALEEFKIEGGSSGLRPTPYLVAAHVQLGQRDAAVRILVQNKAYWSEKIPFFLAIAYANLGERDKAFHWLETMYKIHDPRLLQIKGEPGLDLLRGDPRFHNLLLRMNFPQ